MSLFMPLPSAQETFAQMNEPVLKEIASIDRCTIFSFSHYLPRQDIPDTLGERCSKFGLESDLPYVGFIKSAMASP